MRLRLSGHLIADSEAELDAFGQAFGLGKKDRSSGSPVPHYVLAASRRGAAIVAGAIPLAPPMWAAKLAEINAQKEHLTRRGTRSAPEGQLRLFVA